MDVVNIRTQQLACAVFLLLPALSLQAATPEETGFLLNEQQLREQQQQLRMQERERLLRELERSLTPIEIPESKPPAPALPASDVCFDIKQIVFEGADNMLEEERIALQREWLGRCMTLADIDALRSKIERFYIESGWIMARAYLKPGQNIKSGTLRYVIHEGKLDSVRLNLNGLSDRMQAATAFPGMLEESIYLRDIEQGMDQINRLASSRATMKIEPVEQRAGYSRLLINNLPHNPYRLSLSFDNHGSQSTGEQRGSLMLESDNLLSLNDSISLNLSESTEGRAESSNSSYSLNLSIPYGYWLYTLSLSQSQYQTTSRGDNVVFVTQGNSQTDSLDISRVIHRDKSSKTTAGLVLNIKDTETLLQDVLLQTGTRKLVVADVQLQHVARRKDGNWTAQMTYSRGLSVLGALLDDPLASDDVPRAQFEKLAWNASLTHSFTWRDQQLQYSGALAGQVSRDPLFGSEQIAIGNLGSVRGFRDSPASGDSGLYLKNDIHWRPQFESTGLRGLRLSVGLDAGTVRVRNNNINNTGAGGATLTGMALAAQQQIGLPHDQRLDWSLSIGTALSAPAFISQDSAVVMFRLGWKFW